MLLSANICWVPTGCEHCAGSWGKTAVRHAAVLPLGAHVALVVEADGKVQCSEPSPGLWWAHSAGGAQTWPSVTWRCPDVVGLSFSPGQIPAACCTFYNRKIHFPSGQSLPSYLLNYSVICKDFAGNLNEMYFISFHLSEMYFIHTQNSLLGQSAIYISVLLNTVYAAFLFLVFCLEASQ